VNTHNTQLDIGGVRRFHGHSCPGLAIGIRAAEIALCEIGPHAEDEEVVAIVETDMCAVDAIQYLTGCTFGKGNLIHLDYGKSAFTFVRRSDGKAIRIVLRPQVLAAFDIEAQALLKRVQERKATDEDVQRANEGRQRQIKEILECPAGDLFDVQIVKPVIPSQARIHDSVECAGCGERTMETRVRLYRGARYCIPCFYALECRF
jgi:formylmethanofuran dehydrogenase subunit E